MNTQFARPSSSGNARVWVRCDCGRRFTVRKSKLNKLPLCPKCVAGAKGNAE